MIYSQKVIIIGGNHHNTLGVIRSFGRVGIFPFVILTSGTANSFVLKSKYIQHSWVVTGSESAIEILFSVFSNEQIKPIVIACHDAISSLIDINSDKLKRFFVLPGCEQQGRVTELMNKKTMGELAEEQGMNVPRMLITNYASRHIVSDSFIPCITKPVESRLGAKTEISVFKNRDALFSFLLNNKGNDYIIQQYIDKKFEFQLIGCSLNSGQEIIIPGVSVILRQAPSSNTGFLHYKSMDDTFKLTLTQTKAFVQSIGYSGLFSVEFIRDKAGKDYFLEINFRNDGNTISVFNSGVNLPYIWYLHSIGADYPKEIKSIHEEFVMPEFAELELYQQGLISRIEWKQDMKRATSYMDYAPDDPAPTDGWNKYNKQKRLAMIKRWKHKLFDK